MLTPASSLYVIVWYCLSVLLRFRLDIGSAWASIMMYTGHACCRLCEATHASAARAPPKIWRWAGRVGITGWWELENPDTAGVRGPVPAMTNLTLWDKHRPQQLSKVTQEIEGETTQSVQSLLSTTFQLANSSLASSLIYALCPVVSVANEKTAWWMYLRWG